MFRRRCGCHGRPPFPLGAVLISLGLGVFLARMIPYYLLISIFGIALICLGIRSMMGK